MERALRDKLALYSFDIQQADSAFAEQAYPIHQAVQVVPWALATFTDCTTSPYECWVLTHNETVVGYAILLIVLDEVTLMDIAVEPDWQGHGLGRRLVNWVIERCQALRAISCFLEVRESNTRAIALYETAGFATLERRKNYYPTQDGREDAIMMVRQFKAVAL